MDTKTFELPDRSLSLTYSDQGAGPLTLFFLHGWCLDHSYWAAQVQHFQDRYRVLAVDVPGFGASRAERGNWKIEDMAGDLHQLILALDLRDVVIVGHSMSGELGMETALQAGERVIGLVGVDNFKFVDMEMPQPVQEEYMQLISRLQTDYQNAARDLADRYFFHADTSEAVRQRIRDAYSQADPAVSVPILLCLLAYSAQTTAKLEQLGFPLHVIGNDVPPPFEPGLAAHCRHGYHLEFVPGTGHYPMIEKPDQFNTALGSVLGQVEKG